MKRIEEAATGDHIIFIRCICFYYDHANRGWCNHLFSPKGILKHGSDVEWNT